MAPAEEVDVEMGHGFAAVRAVIDRDAKAAFGEAKIGSDFSSDEKEMAEKGLILRSCFADAGDGLFRDD